MVLCFDSKNDSDTVVETWAKKPSSIFRTFVRLKNYPAKSDLGKQYRSKQQKVLGVPFHPMENVVQEVNNLIIEEVTKKLKNFTVKPWLNPITITVVKK